MIQDQLHHHSVIFTTITIIFMQHVYWPNLKVSRVWQICFHLECCGLVSHNLSCELVLWNRPHPQATTLSPLNRLYILTYLQSYYSLKQHGPKDKFSALSTVVHSRLHDHVCPHSAYLQPSCSPWHNRMLYEFAVYALQPSHTSLLLAPGDDPARNPKTSVDICWLMNGVVVIKHQLKERIRPMGSMR